MYLRSLFEKLFIDGIQLITKLKSNMNYNYGSSDISSDMTIMKSKQP